MLSEGSAYDNLLKILLIGDSGVGKSSILLRFTTDEFDEQQLSTIGVDFKVKYINLRGKRLKLAIWDTAGQERFRTLTASYYRGAQGVILVYDVGSRSSFENLQFWLDEVQRYSTQSDVIKMLVANKQDTRNHEVDRYEGEGFAFSNSMLFIETSAKTCQGIQHAFEELIQKILECPSLLINTSPSTGRAHQLRETENVQNNSACSC